MRHAANHDVPDACYARSMFSAAEVLRWLWAPAHTGSGPDTCFREVGPACSVWHVTHPWEDTCQHQLFSSILLQNTEDHFLSFPTWIWPEIQALETILFTKVKEISESWG